MSVLPVRQKQIIVFGMGRICGWTGKNRKNNQEILNGILSGDPDIWFHKKIPDGAAVPCHTNSILILLDEPKKCGGVRATYTLYHSKHVFKHVTYTLFSYIINGVVMPNL